MFAEAKLVYVTEDELTMLKDVIGVDVFDGVVDSVDMRVAVFKCRLENKRCWESITCGGTVIGAGVSTLAFDISNVGVLRLL
jgi:hypothetical protein